MAPARGKDRNAQSVRGLGVSAHPAAAPAARAPRQVPGGERPPPTPVPERSSPRPRVQVRLTPTCRRRRQPASSSSRSHSPAWQLPPAERPSLTAWSWPPLRGSESPVLPSPAGERFAVPAPSAAGFPACPPSPLGVPIAPTFIIA